MEILFQGLRVDGRRPQECRRFKCECGIAKADGSARVEMGHTHVMAMVLGPKEPNFKPGLSVDFSIAFDKRKKLKRDPQFIEIAAFIKSAFEPVLLNLASEVEVFVQVLQMDGGYLAASINATCLALIDAGIPVLDYVVACSAGYYKEPLLDLNYIEESNEIPLVTIAIQKKSKQVIMMNMESKLHMDYLQPTLDMALLGCESIGNEMNATMQAYLQKHIK